jgi:hypothetical protein
MKILLTIAEDVLTGICLGAFLLSIYAWGSYFGAMH